MFMPPLLLLGLPLTLDVLGIVTGLAAVHGSQNGYASRSNTPTPSHATVCAWNTTKYLGFKVGSWYQVLGICSVTFCPPRTAKNDSTLVPSSSSFAAQVQFKMGELKDTPACVGLRTQLS